MKMSTEDPERPFNLQITSASILRTIMRGILPPIGLWPLLLFLGVFFVLPLVGVILGSVHFPDFTLAEYRVIFSEPVYIRVVYNTFLIAGGVTLLCLVLGYPIAVALISVTPWMRALIFICIIMPLLTSFLVRTYAWIILLQRNGVINDVLRGFGLIDSPLSMMYNRIGTFTGMTHVLLPFMILPLYSVMRGIDPRLLEAARNLGAPGHQVFLRIYLPLSLPGITAGALFVFMLALGFYITPALLGGAPDMTIAVLIERQAAVLLNRPLAAALATVLLVFSLVVYVIYTLLFGADKAFSSMLDR